MERINLKSYLESEICYMKEMGTRVPHSNALHFMKERDLFHIYLRTKTIFMYHFLILLIVILCSLKVSMRPFCYHEPLPEGLSLKGSCL